MTVHFIGAGPAWPTFINGMAAIAEVQLHRRRCLDHPPELLAYCPTDARVTDTAPMSLDEIELEYVAAHRAGTDVAARHS